ncbi:hypothetical protein [[Eubacterium] cellulosolvens]
MVKKKPPEIGPGTEISRSLIILDALVLLILISSVSIAMLWVSSIQKDSTIYYTEYNETDEYVETSMHVVFSSTVPIVTYVDSAGDRTEYAGQSVESLILIDLALRNNKAELLNESNLELGLESAILSFFTSVFGERGDFILWAGFDGYDDINAEEDLAKHIMISNLVAPPSIGKDLNPGYETHLTPLSTGKSSSAQNPVVIQLYFV